MQTSRIQFYLAARVFARVAFFTGIIAVMNAVGSLSISPKPLLNASIAVVFGAIFIFCIYMIKVKKAVLILSAEGITAGADAKSVIPWENIRAIQSAEIQRQKLLCLAIDRKVMEGLHRSSFLEKRRRWIVSRLQLVPTSETDYLFAAISNLTESPDTVEKIVTHLHALTPQERIAELSRLQNEQARR